MLIEIREERSNDVAAVRGVNRRAFGQEQESNRKQIKVVLLKVLDVPL